MMETAKAVVKNHKPYAKRKAPAKPIDVPIDLVMVGLMQRSQNGLKIKNDEREILQLFAAWRTAVYEVESKNAGNLQLLMGVIIFIEDYAAKQKAERDGGKPEPAPTPSSSILREFIRTEYGWRVPAKLDHGLARKAAEHLSFEMKVLNKNLRFGEMME